MTADKPRFVAFLPAIGWFLLSLYLFTLPGKSLPQSSWFDVVHMDKLVHITLFAVLVTLIYWPYRKAVVHNAMAKALLVSVLAVCYGIAIEFIQKNYIPNRSFDGGDIAADAVGSFLPLYLVARRARKQAAIKGSV